MKKAIGLILSALLLCAGASAADPGALSLDAAETSEDPEQAVENAALASVTFTDK